MNAIITCQMCETAKATAIKLDTEWTFDDEGTETATQVARLICGECAEHYYDGSEDYPGTVPLAVAA